MSRTTDRDHIARLVMILSCAKPHVKGPLLEVIEQVLLDDQVRNLVQEPKSRAEEALGLSKTFPYLYEAAAHLDDLINVRGFKNSVMLRNRDGFSVFAVE